jgi:hypothetical protein
MLLIIGHILDKRYNSEGIKVAKKKEKVLMRGSQLIARGDIVRVMDKGSPIQCRVLSCLATADGACVAGLEILEGERKGERITATLRAGEECS